ncbi:hypothetical protein PR002_g17753 [Phytophthora rubi]|uniref:Uncharacterized protein n=1 Tax=Phytophthora rubi TaxID=129364 RepID=A0A6A3K3B5_9STRA|nr:hypothetical protein PR002_g17753 [Phytophthora rubi]
MTPRWTARPGWTTHHDPTTTFGGRSPEVQGAQPRVREPRKPRQWAAKRQPGERRHADETLPKMPQRAGVAEAA